MSEVKVKTEPPKESIKETIEQILIAFVMAFIFRCFMVEAFVIPTGSMAPTLLGQNMSFRCSDCGWQWKVNYSRAGGSSSDMGADPFAMDVATKQKKTLSIRCPNCGYKLPRFNAADEANDAFAPNVRFGDRILVIKYGYLINEPKRWDVVVFKSPDVRGGSISPSVVSPPDAYQENYIKRLVGKPGETVMILDGDVYVTSEQKKLADLRPDDFTIQTKSWDVQEALWRIVYDNDHQPIGNTRTYVSPLTKQVEVDEPAWRQPWTPVGNNGWTASTRTFEFDPSKGNGAIKFDVNAVPSLYSLTDWLGYDITSDIGDPRLGVDQFRPGRSEYPNMTANLSPVSDLKLAMTYERLEGDGKLRLNIQKRNQIAIVELDGSTYTIKRSVDGQETQIATGTKSGIGSGHGSRIEFSFVDYQATLRIDGKIVAQSKPGDFAPNVKALLDEFESNNNPPMGSVWIDAAGHRASLSHLSLWRDIYYISRMLPNRLDPKWAIPRKFPTGTGKPPYGAQLIQLDSDEYFVLGDNSYLSGDARMWYMPINLPDENLFVDSGRVPERFLIGKAFFVYWPSGFPITNSAFRLVPNFGEMRFIK